MDEIIYLEPDEEITSVIDKIKNAQSPNLGLVIPRDATLLQSVVNLRLLSREANSLNKKISIVTADKIGRNLASQIGLPVFSSIDEKKPISLPPVPTTPTDEVLEVEPEAETTQEDDGNPTAFKVQHYQTGQGEINRSMSKNEPPVSPRETLTKEVSWNRHGKPAFQSHQNENKGNSGGSPVGAILARKDKDFKNLHRILWPVIGVFIILCLVATYFLLPKATVSVFVPSENLQKDLNLSVSDQVKVQSVENNVFPGTLIESTSTKDGKFTTTGKKDIGQKAKGSIVIYNNLDSNSHSFAAGTKVSSSNKTFITQASVTVSGAGVQSGKPVPGTAKVDIEAEGPGAEYNVKAGRFTILGLPAAQQEFIYGQSTADLTGGLSKVAQVVSQQDYDSAKDGLIKDLTDTLNTDMKAKAGENEMLEKAVTSSTPEITSSAKVNDEAADFQMTVKIKDQAVVFSKVELGTFLNDILQKDIAADKAVTIPSDAGLTLTVTNTAYDKGQLDLSAKVNAKVSAKVSSDAIAQSILGKKKAEAINIVQAQKGIDHVEINFSPSWWFKIVPNLKNKVIIKVEYIDQGQK